MSGSPAGAGSSDALSESETRDGVANQGWIFLRGVTFKGCSRGVYSQLETQRVRDASVVVDGGGGGHSGDSPRSGTWWKVAPGDDHFLTRLFIFFRYGRAVFLE